MPLAELIARQQRWARARWPNHAERRAPSLADNLIGPMSREFADQFAGGSGSELGRGGKPGKMQSLRSSSALAYNVFAPWHGKDLTPLARALGHVLRDRTVHFEKKYPHGLGKLPPHLDVVLDAEQERPLAIESKFAEPYGTKQPDPALAAKYFPTHRERWRELGMPRCQHLAESVGTTMTFERLGAGQLLKHLLGLAYTTRRRPRLHYIWFDSGCSEAQTHHSELSRFSDAVGDDVDFSHQTYQELITSLGASPDPIPGYAEYLRSRYASA